MAAVAVKTADIEQSLAPVASEEDDRFGYVQVYRCADLLVFSKERRSCEMADFTRDLFQVRERLKLNEACMLRMIDYSTEQTKVEDETIYTVKAYFEYPTGDLAYDIDERSVKKMYFSANDLILMLSNMAEAIAFLQKNKMIHGDIRPKYFAYFETDKKFKLLDRLGAPAPAWQVQQANIKAGVDLYMSPMLYLNLQRGNRRFRHNPYKSDSFSLGIVILECGLMESIQGVYNAEQKAVHSLSHSGRRSQTRHADQQVP